MSAGDTPLDVYPLRYQLHTVPEVGAGVKEIECKAVVEWIVTGEVAASIKLHCVGLMFCSISLHLGAKEFPILKSSISQLPEEEMLEIKFPYEVQKGQTGAVKFHYLARISQGKNMGVYLTRDLEGNPTFATHFEPLKARSFLPCFDHPRIKAQFKMTVLKKRIPEGFTVLSNTAPESEDSERIIFKETPITCSYLLCLVISKLHWTELSIDSRLRLRVYVPQSVPLDTATSCLSLLKKAVTFYETLFAQDLRLEKLDLVGLKALPPIAMENLGCLAFRLNYVILGKQTPISRVQRIVRLVAHEVSHHWFGNSTSISSWSIVWLKEGFARYLEYLFTVYLFPSWDYWTDFTQGIADCAKQMDAMPSRTHPLEPPSDPSPLAIADSFDFITYNKGASLVRMLAETVGWSVFCSGVQIFLSNHRDSSATVTDFCCAVQAACRAPRVVPPIAASVLGVTDTPITSLESFNVEEWTETWRTAASHPVVFARVVKGHIGLQQFLIPDATRQVPLEVEPSPFTLPVVVMFRCPGQLPTTVTVLLPPTTEEHWVPLPHNDCTVLLNPCGASFCRIWYDALLFERILRTYAVHPSLTRLGLFLDCFNLLALSSVHLQQQDTLPIWWAPRGCTGLEHQLYSLLAAFRDAQETHNNVVSAAATAALDLLYRSQGESCEAGMRRVMAGCFQHLLPRVKDTACHTEWREAEGLEGFGRYVAETELSPATAGLVLSCLSSAWHTETIVYARELRDRAFEVMSSPEGGARPDLTVVVGALKVCVQHGGEKDWWDAWHLYTWALQPDDLEHDEPLPATGMEPRDLSWVSPCPHLVLYGKVPQGCQLRAPLLECFTASPHVHIAKNVAKMSQKPSFSQDTSDIISLCTGFLQNTALIDQVLLAASARVVWFLIKLAPSFGSPLWLARNESYWQNMSAPLKAVIRSNVQITRTIVDNLRVALPS